MVLRRALLILAVVAPLPAFAADLQVSGYSWLPDPVPNGAKTQFSIRTTNNGPGIVADAAVNIQISSRFRVDAGDFPSYCSLSGVAGAQTLTCHLPSLPVGNFSFDYNATAISVGSANTTAAISSPTANDMNAANDSLIVTPAVQTGADLSVVKDDGLVGHSIIAGGIISYKLNPANAGPDATAAIRVVDELPSASEFEFQSATGPNWSCSQAGTQVTCNYTGAATVGQLPQITISGRAVSQTNGSITNSASAKPNVATVLDPIASNDASSVVTTVRPGSDIRASKTMPATIVQGTSATITLGIYNDGPQSVSGATVSDTIAGEFTLGSLPAGCSAAGQTVTCAGGDLANGTNRTFVIPVTATSATPANQINTASITLPPGFADPDLGNNSATASYRIVPPTADLRISKTKTPNPVSAGQNMTSTIVVRNNGPAVLNYAPGTPIRVTDEVSANETYVSAGAAWSCAQAATLITCNTVGTGTLNVNGTITLTLVTKAGAVADEVISNNACTGSTGGSLATPLDTNTANDCSGLIGVRATTIETDLTITKEVSLNPAGPWIQAGLPMPSGTADLYIRFTAHNLGTGLARTVNVTDTLPNSLNDGSFVTGFGQISASKGAVGYTTNTGRIAWTFTDLAGGDTETAVVRVSRPMSSGNFTNTASITSPDTIDIDNGNNSSDASYTVAPLADIVLTNKSISPDPLRVGTIGTYTISVRNSGANPAAAVTVTDTIDPARFELVGNPTSSKGGASCSKNDASGLVSCDLGTFNRNDNFQVTQQVRPRFPFGGITDFTTNATHTNTAQVATTTDKSSTSNNSFTMNHEVSAPGFDLSVTKQEPGPEFDPLRFGEELVYDIRVSNTGPSRATNIVVTDIPQPPSGYGMTLAGFTVNPVAANSPFTLYAPPAPNCVPVAGGKIECRLDAGSPANNYLDPLRQVIFRVRFTPTGAAPSGSLTFTDEAQVTAFEQDNTTVNQADSQLANNKAVQNTTVLPSADLEVVSKTPVTPSPAGINEPIEYAIVVRNNGVSPITQVRVTDTLPAGLELTGAAPTATPAGAASVSSIACTGTTTVLCTLDGTFPPDGSQVTIHLRARAAYPFSGSLLTNLTNTATIAPGLDSGGQDLARDGVSTNNSKTAAIQIAESSIAGSAFEDKNVDNAIQAGEGLAGVSVMLTGTDAFGNAIPPRTITTDANGNYLFDRLPRGTYQLVETQPAGLLDFRETAGTAGGTVNNGVFDSTPAANTIAAINLPANTAATGYLFQETRAASIEGIVWRDANNNGAIDGGETGVPATDFPSTPHIGLTGKDYAGNDVNLKTTVDANGHYQFTDLPPSDATGYTVTELVQPQGLSDGLDTNGAGTVVAGSSGRTAPEAILAGPLTPGQVLTGRNFGEIPTSKLSGTVFLDPNGNATRDNGENSGLAGAIIRLTGTNDVGQAVDCSITTDGTGNYAFPSATDANPACRVLRPGSYTLTETPPPGLEHSGAFIGSAGGSAGGASGPNTPAPGQANTSVTGITITAGTDATRYDFGATGRGVGGYVYIDRNGGGTRDPGESGIAGVTVTLSGKTATGQDVCTLITCTVTTDAAGNYLFANVPGSSADGYTLTEQVQASAPLSAYADGTDAAGQVNGAVRGTAGNDTINKIVLGAGELGTNYAFGERAGSLAGSTYIDANDDGIRQAGEFPLPGITVTLSGTTAAGQDICTQRAALDPALTCTVTTGADGNYRFDDLPQGNYTLVESQPSAFADGRESAGTPGGTVNNGSFGSSPAENRIANVALGAGVAGTGYDFGERAITIAGRVFKDPERDGNDAGGEPGIPGVTITLRQGGTVVATTTTGADGSYRFENLPAGSYTVEETQPAGYGSSTPDSRSVNVSAGANQSIDFGDTVSSLAGSVFVDTDDNGVRQPGERDLAGVTVRLTGTTAGGQPVDRSTTTDSKGDYRFDNLLAGTYALTETQPAGFGDGQDVAGTAKGKVANDTVSDIELPTGTDATGYLFGEHGQGQGGTAYVDTNLNGVQDTGEPGIPGVSIELQKPDGSVLQTVTTGPDGHYDFSDIEAGDYVIVEHQPQGYGDAEEHRANRVPLTVAVGTPATPINFGERIGSLAGLVYNDTNGNGRRDADEPVIPGTTVTLTGSDTRGNPVTLTTVSGPDGSYRFTGVPGGTYSVIETQPTGYDDGIDTPGDAGGSTSGDTISGVTLGAAQDATGYLFSERGAGAQLGGRVWLDRDHDRAFDTDEPVYGDWIVELHLGDTLIATTTTGADGSYRFTGVAPGAGYQVLFRNPANNALYGSARPNETGAAITEGTVSPSNPAGARTEDGTLRDLKLTPGAVSCRSRSRSIRRAWSMTSWCGACRWKVRRSTSPGRRASIPPHIFSAVPAMRPRLSAPTGSTNICCCRARRRAPTRSRSRRRTAATIRSSRRASFRRATARSRSAPRPIRCWCRLMMAPRRPPRSRRARPAARPPLII